MAGDREGAAVTGTPTLPVFGDDLAIGANPFGRRRRRDPNSMTVKRRSIAYRAACRGIRAPDWAPKKWHVEYLDCAMAFGEAHAAQHIRKLMADGAEANV
jgi:hypothetical protein